MNERNEHGIVIVGGGFAGIKAAEGAREAGWEGRIRLIGAEPYVPYERPPLSKDILLGKSGPREAFVHDDGWAVAHDVELLLGASVSAIDLATKSLTVPDDKSIEFDRLILATGSTTKSAELPGDDLDGVYTLRTIDDSLAIRDQLMPGANVVVVGGNWIAAEVASAARQRGANVALIGHQSQLLEHSLGAEIGEFYTNVHRDQGVDLHLGVSVTRLEGDGHVAQVKLSDDTTLDADVVVLGTGVTPNVELAEKAGLTVNDGVEVDEHLQTTNANVFAVGDIASAWAPQIKQHIRVQHWDTARQQGKLAGKNAVASLTGSALQVYDEIPYFYSDQYDVGMEYSRWPVPYDEVVYRGDPATGEFIAFQLAHGIVIGGINVNVWDVNNFVQDLIRSGKPVNRQVLADQNVEPSNWVERAIG